MSVLPETVVPAPEESGSLQRLSRLMHADEPSNLTVVRGGVDATLPESAIEILTRVSELLAAGRGVAIVPVDQALTTREAAELLGVSRPTLIKLLDEGEIGFSRPSSSRRIPLDEVIAYKRRRSRKRRALLAEMTADAVEEGAYGMSPAAGGDTNEE